MTPKNYSLLQFPCTFQFKIIGTNNQDFEIFVAVVMRKHFPDLSEGAITSRVSKEGLYLSLTVHVKATSQEQIDAAYHELTTDDRVLFAL